MTYFKVIFGLECGVDKSICSFGYPDYCSRCIYKKLTEANFLIENVEAIEQDTDEKKQEMNYINIWRKYKDILNIRHIIILAKKGIPIFNMPVGGRPFDATLLSGFIHANIIFSVGGLPRNVNNENSNLDYDRNFYEFNYKDFNILLRNGELCRICLILDNKPSNNLRDLLSKFVEIFEKFYENELKKFEKTGNLDLFNSAKKMIEKNFEINMIYPQALAFQILPNIINNFSIIQKAIFEFSNDLLKEKPYFFIPNLLNTTTRILGKISSEKILWNIYQMIQDGIIISKDLKFQRDELDIKNQNKQVRESEIQKILEKKEIKDVINECKFISFDEALKKIQFYSKKAEIAKKNSAYQEALNEYEKALAYAREFVIEPQAGNISFQILELLKLNQQVELEFIKDQVNKFERKKDYIKVLKYLFEIKDLLNSDLDMDKNEKMLIKVNQRIKKVQSYLH